MRKTCQSKRCCCMSYEVVHMPTYLTSGSACKNFKLFKILTSSRCQKWVWFYSYQSRYSPVHCRTPCRLLLHVLVCSRHPRTTATQILWPRSPLYSLLPSAVTYGEFYLTIIAASHQKCRKCVTDPLNLHLVAPYWSELLEKSCFLCKIRCEHWSPCHLYVILLLGDKTVWLDSTSNRFQLYLQDLNSNLERNSS